MSALRLPENITNVELSPEDRQKAFEAAIWITASPHEWEWTPEQQGDMARYVLWAMQRLELIERISCGEPFQTNKIGEG